MRTGEITHRHSSQTVDLLKNQLGDGWRERPHADVAAAGNRFGQAHDVRQVPPIRIAFVPIYGWLVCWLIGWLGARMVGRAVLGEPQPGRGTRPACPRRIVAHADNLAGPVLHLAPCGQLLEILRRQIHRRPRDEPSVLFLAERLGTRNRRPPLARLRPRAAVLRPLDPVQDQDRIRTGAGEGV